MEQDLALFGVCYSLSVLCLWGNLRGLRRRRLLEDTPTSKTLGVFIGLAELKGTAEAAEPLTSYLAPQRCVHYAWSVEEAWSRMETETYTDDKGKTQTRVVQKSGWTTVAQGGETIPFYLQDDTGVVLVRPEGATLETVSFFSETVSRGDPLYYGKGPAGSVPDSDGRRRFTEQGLPLHAPLYVIGTARERSDLVAPEIAANEEAELFLISTRSEEKVKSAMGGWAWLWGVAGLLLSAGPVLVIAGADRYVSDPLVIPPLVFAPVPLYVMAWLLGWVWMVHNSLVGLRQRVRQGWSLIDVQLKRRHDLIPRLAAAVSGLSTHEQSVQTAVTLLRAQAAATAPGVAGQDFAGLAATLRVVVEKYPQLTAQPAFLALQTQLIETEQRVALARAYYNDIATEFATRLERVPDRWVAALRSMQPEALLQATDFERAVVQVDFSDAPPRQATP
jgi:hypothetical protein